MITYLTISLITLCFCRITYLWVRHKRENKREVALADELIEDDEEIITDENVINVFDSTIGMVPRGRYYPNRDYFIPLRETKKNFLPKKDIKAHTLVERKYTIRRPGVYTREVDLSIVNPHVILNLNRENG